MALMVEQITILGGGLFQIILLDGVYQRLEYLFIELGLIMMPEFFLTNIMRGTEHTIHTNYTNWFRSCERKRPFVLHSREARETGPPVLA